MANAREIIKNFPDELKGDDHLFWILDLDLGDEGRPHLVTGEQAEGFCYNVIRGDGNYDIRYAEPNAGSIATKRAIAVKEIRDEMKQHFGSYDQPLTIAEELAQAKAKIADLEKEKQEAAAKDAKPEKAGKAAKEATSEDSNVESKPEKGGDK